MWFFFAGWNIMEACAILNHLSICLPWICIAIKLVKPWLGPSMADGEPRHVSIVCKMSLRQRQHLCRGFAQNWESVCIFSCCSRWSPLVVSQFAYSLHTARRPSGWPCDCEKSSGDRVSHYEIYETFFLKEILFSGYHSMNILFIVYRTFHESLMVYPKFWSHDFQWQPSLSAPRRPPFLPKANRLCLRPSTILCAFDEGLPASQMEIPYQEWSVGNGWEILGSKCWIFHLSSWPNLSVQ